MFLAKFIYDLTGRPEPTDYELMDETDRLLYLKSAEEPDYLDKEHLNSIDSEVLGLWIKRRFEPTLILLILGSDDNHQQAKSELVKMERYKTLIDKWFRHKFVERYAMQRIRELCFDNNDNLKIQGAVIRAKKTLTFLSKHLEQNSPENLTLQNTDRYTTVDVLLYNYLKRIVVGKYKDHGLKAHVKLCDPLVRFMSRYAKKNTYVLNVSSEDPLAVTGEEPTLLADMTKPVLIVMSVVLFFLWRTR